MTGCRKWESEADLVGSSLLVGLSRSVGLGLLGLIGDGVASGLDTDGKLEPEEIVGPKGMRGVGVLTDRQCWRCCP